MAQEIERKFLLRSDAWRTQSESSERVRQGYLIADGVRSVRVRTKGGRGFLTIKGAAIGLARPEFEYAIPLADAEALLDTLCHAPQIDKTRHLVRHDGMLWEIDEFHGANAGLIVAEVELASVDQVVALPGWVGAEVTGDGRYYNSQLAVRPFSTWTAGRPHVT
jgi:adenylate cyclase